MKSKIPPIFQHCRRQFYTCQLVNPNKSKMEVPAHDGIHQQILEHADSFNKESLLKRYGKEETAELLRKTNQIYRDMLRRADDIGKGNPMASNLYEASFFLRSGTRRTDRFLWMNCVQSQRR